MSGPPNQRSPIALTKSTVRPYKMATPRWLPSRSSRDIRRLGLPSTGSGYPVCDLDKQSSKQLQNAHDHSRQSGDGEDDEQGGHRFRHESSLSSSASVSAFAGSANYGIFAIRATSSPAIQAIAASANMNSAATALTGTTGTDAKVTVGVDASGNIYIQNQLGSAQNISVNVMTV